MAIMITVCLFTKQNDSAMTHDESQLKRQKRELFRLAGIIQ